MRKSLVMSSFLLAGGWLCAQTNPPPAVPAHPTEINAGSADFDLKDRRATYHDHVVVNDPKVRLTCELLVLDLPEHGGRLSHVLAQTNVVVDFADDSGTKYHITSDQAVYHYAVANLVTNETVTFTGHPVASSAQGTLYGEPMIWDRADGHLHIKNVHMSSNQNLNTSGNGLGLPAGNK